MGRLESNIRLAAALKTTQPDDVTFRGSDGRIYRSVLTRHKLYKNGKRRLPETFEKLSPEKRPEVEGAIIKFLTAVRAQNAEFLKLCVRTYAQKLDADE